MGALNAVVGPERLRAVGGFNRVGEGVLAGVGAGEGDVVAGVPVLGEDGVVEARSKRVDTGEDGIGVRDGKGAPWEEVELHVDDEEGVGVAELHSSKRTILCKGSGVG